MQLSHVQGDNINVQMEQHAAHSHLVAMGAAHWTMQSVVATMSTVALHQPRVI